ncbi:Ig-like domain-containing protein [Mycetocola zhadangensis]|uniref:Tandem-95 repeat protein n=1 Tax=Mycetocola zhadangensis TaxID=1164595 RepID=A0A3L7IWG5_9MICO|nr:Ig-like domain-containing protein [Mycetocola zhadangensis]RLQ82543.1 tandem-95 repeat protein [Mycetocola zhadangensis]GGF00408.1 fibronectin type III [Mycetocola zhadangensis]
MIRSWLRAHRSALATVTSGTVICAVIATVAVVSNGYRAQRLDLGDGAVWVVNEARQAIGRANTQVFELNTAVRSASAQIDVLQSGETVLLVDNARSALDIIDPSTSTVTDSVPLPPGTGTVALGGGRVVIETGGDVWFVPLADLPTFDAEADPDLSLGADAVASVNTDGDLFVFSPETSSVYRVPATSETVTDTTEVPEPTGGVQLSSVGSDFVLLDEAESIVRFAGRSVPLPEADGARLQLPSLSGDRALVGVDNGLVAVPNGGGDASFLTEDATGAASRPASVGDCAFGAWSNGSVFTECDGEPTLSELEGLAGAADLVFRSNGDHVVLNDVAGGAAWAVQSGNRMINNWDDLVALDDDEEEVEDNNEDTPPEYDEAQQPPTAISDEFGARPGRTAPLPVLLNDFDPNGDVLMISSFTPLSDSAGRVEAVNNNQQLQVTLEAMATGVHSFDYTITDGRGATASATVTLTVRQPSDNGPPAQARTTKGSVASGARLSQAVLGDWVDPDGDPFYLTQAAVAAPDLVQHTPDGTVIYTDAGAGGELKEIGLTVSDGSAEGTGIFAVTVSPPGAVPIVTEAFGLTVEAGLEVEVAPLAHVRGGTGPLRLANVPAKAGATITPDYDGGTFRFSSTEVRDHYIDFSITDGTLTQTGFVRIQVIAPADAGAKPVTVPHTVFIREQSSDTVDVLAGDFDPAGGVLVVTGVSNIPPLSGIRAEILEQRMLRITLTNPLDGPVSFNYRVSNGVADAEGTVTVVQIPNPAKRQPPVAFPDSVSVRVGDAIDVPVLANDTHPDGDPLTLAPELAGNLPDGGGLLFTAGKMLRYLAPDKPGNFTASYRALAPDGQWSDAQVVFNVREVDTASNAAPVPKTVTSRVLSGERVRITIPLGGIDPDGDSVQLIGQSSNPNKGAVTGAGTDWFDYEAGAYSTGTDSFEYTVVDALGKQATGLVRIGISAKLDGSRVPVATPDEVITRPSSTVAVRVLANDSDPDGGTLAITSVEPTGEGATADIDDDVIRVTVPRGEGRYGFIYEIENKYGNTSSTFLTVVVRNDAPLARPVASDIVLTIDDIADRSTIDVNVLRSVFWADGPASELDVSIPAGFGDGASVTKSKRVQVRLDARSQIIPFQVSNPDDATVNALAFIWVPGLDDALPQLRSGAQPISVVSGETVTIPLNDYVVATGNKSVRLTDAAKVRATHSNGADLVVDATTLRFTSADLYFGPASISFEVTDGESATDPNGRVATLVLPIEVSSRENQPPVFAGGSIDFEPGQEKTIDLVKLTTYPYADDLDELSYRVLDPRPAGFTVAVNGQQLMVTAGADVARGSTPSILVGVRDAVNDGVAGRIQLGVVPSTRPLAVPATDTAIAQRGTTTPIDVLANDGATNPFPGTPLRVVAVRGLDGGNLPAGVTVVPSADKSRLTVSVAADAAAIDTSLQYQVADATDDPARYTWGTVRISVQDRPDPVSNLRVTGFADRRISLTFSPGASNNSAITGFDVELFRVSNGTSLGVTSCASTTCDVATGGNGSDNSVRVAVSARNARGASDPVRFGEPVWSDVIPAAPTNLAAAPLDGGLMLSWDAVPRPGQGSPVDEYVVTVPGNLQGTPACSASRCSVGVTNLANGNTVQFSVSARNDAYPALTTWNSASGQGKPFGAPSAGSASAVSDAVGGSATVSWSGFDGRGDDIRGYFVGRLNSPSVSPNACTVSSPAPGTVSEPSGGSIDQVVSLPPSASSYTFPDLANENSTYYFVVWGHNGAGCTATNVASAVFRPLPPAPSANPVMQFRDTADTLRDFYVPSIAPAGFTYQVSLAGANDWRAFGNSGYPRDALGLPYGQTVSFQLRACNVWGSGACGQPSAVYTAPEPSITLNPTALEYDAASTTWSWAAGPDNGALPATYACGAVNDPAITGTATGNTCVLSAQPVDGRVWIDVTVNGYTKRFLRP